MNPWISQNMGKYAKSKNEGANVQLKMKMTAVMPLPLIFLGSLSMF
jgi:hypothetical protein